MNIIHFTKFLLTNKIFYPLLFHQPIIRIKKEAGLKNVNL